MLDLLGQSRRTADRLAANLQNHVPQLQSRTRGRIDLLSVLFKIAKANHRDPLGKKPHAKRHSAGQKGQVAQLVRIDASERISSPCRSANGARD